MVCFEKYLDRALITVMLFLPPLFLFTFCWPVSAVFLNEKLLYSPQITCKFLGHEWIENQIQTQPWLKKKKLWGCVKQRKQYVMIGADFWHILNCSKFKIVFILIASSIFIKCPYWLILYLLPTICYNKLEKFFFFLNTTKTAVWNIPQVNKNIVTGNSIMIRYERDILERL